ncbi:MAG: asparaginase [Candidatus Zixiibacteriota bacterium]|nr:MAG: asparaginase [candidate division Zixibacteria bacterium]
MKPAAKVYRGDWVEAIHYASVAVLNEKSELTHYLGDPDSIFMTRSSIKPFQLIPLIISGAADEFGFTSEQLSIMCGSHAGTDKHRDMVLSNLNQAGNNPEHLQCGCHRPIWMEVDGVYPASGEDLDPARHNCSGKHSGFLALARHLGDPPEEYLNPESKSQKLVKEILSAYCEYDLREVRSAIDGCSAPNYPLPLKNLALGFKKLASGEGDSPEIQAAVKRIKEAMTSYPFMVSGEKRFDYDIKRSFPGNAVCKIGAEAVQGLGFSEPAVGIAVKVSDGNFRAMEPIVVEVLKQLGIVKNMVDYPHLARYERPPVRNSRDIITGNILAEFKLKKC